MTLPIQVGPSTITMNRDDRFVVCQPDGRIERLAEEGFFARDTRFVSGYEVFLNGQRPALLNASPVQFYSSRFEYTNPELLDRDGVVPRNSLGLRIDRTVSGGVHEDYDLVNYGRRPVRLTIEIEIESDFADIFDVKAGRLVRRGEINARWFRSNRELRTTYVHREFVRELVIQADRSDSKPQFANGRFVFIAEVPPKGVWHTCLRWLPLTSSKRRPSTLACNAVAGPLPDEGQTHLRRVRIETPNHTVRRAWDQAQLDMASLQLEDPTFAKGVFIPAAGVPWFVTLFGRDSLVVSMQGISGYPEFAAGALRRLSELQATADDPERDMEPGKIPHEIRHGELAQLRILPFQPYYGTHDATSLFVIVISYLYQWLGDVAVLERYLPNAEAAMRWIDQSGDRDRDGFQEYKTRSTHGYYNQGWKDAGDAIPHADGSLAPLPLALCELQGYVYDAKQRMADIYEILGRTAQERPAAGRGARAVRPLQRDVLVGGRGDLLPRSRRRQATDRERRLQRRALPGERHRAAGAGEPGRRAPDGARHVVGLGDPDPLVGPRRVQPVQLSDRLGLAARQRPDRRRFPALRPRCRGCPGRARACSRRPSGSRPTACPSCSPAFPATRAASRSSTSVPASRRRGLPARSSGWWRSCAASMPRATRLGPGCTSIRRSPSGSPS